LYFIFHIKHILYFIFCILGDEKYLGRFNKHYQAIMKYISQGPMLLDVHMHRPNTNSKNFMDALLAFWPGLQVYNFTPYVNKNNKKKFI
jgi:hypothetical protein